MRALLRHLAVALGAAFVAFVTTPSIAQLFSAFSLFMENESATKFGFLAALVSAFLWFLFSLLLRKPKLQQWIIIGFVSPFFDVPLFYQAVAFQSGYGTDFPEIGSALLLGLITAGLISPLLIPIGMVTGAPSSMISRFIETNGEQYVAPNP